MTQLFILALDQLCLSGYHDWTDWIWAGRVLNPETMLYRRRCRKPGCKAMEERNR